MSYILALTSLTAPEQDAQAWEWLETLKQQDDEEQDTSPVLLSFYQVLTDMYPCLSSYAPGDTMREYSPWSDGPLINNFGHQLAVLGLSKNVERVTRFIVLRAKEMNITVFDEQTGTIHRPLQCSAAREPDVVEVLQLQLLRMPLEFSTAFAARVQLRMWGLLVPTPEEHQTGFWYWPEKARATHLLDVFMAVNFLFSHAGARLDGCNFSSAEQHTGHRAKRPLRRMELCRV